LIQGKGGISSENLSGKEDVSVSDGLRVFGLRLFNLQSVGFITCDQVVVYHEIRAKRKGPGAK
jgi:hypothetical protein